jgi:putative ABC transport system ATP-binding protein
MTTISPLIYLKDITKVFTTDHVETHALSHVSLEIRRGEFVFIAGPSGCGKSTLLSILGLLESASAGMYMLDGLQVNGLLERERALVRNRHIGFVFQAFHLVNELTVQDNVELPLRYGPDAPASWKSRVQEALEQVGMAHRARHHPSQLSGGEQQRVAVARAIVANPSIILADEPTGNLDTKNGELVMSLLRDLHANGLTVCIVTHDPRYARTAGRRISLLDGKVVDDAHVRADIETSFA